MGFYLLKIQNICDLENSEFFYYFIRKLFFSVRTFLVVTGFLENNHEASPKKQGRRQHGFDGFGRTHQFLEMGPQTYRFLEN